MLLLPITGCVTLRCSLVHVICGRFSLVQDAIDLFNLRKCLYANKIVPDVFGNYFQLNNNSHSHVTRSSDNIQLYTAVSPYTIKCIRLKGLFICLFVVYLFIY